MFASNVLGLNMENIILIGSVLFSSGLMYRISRSLGKSKRESGGDAIFLTAVLFLLTELAVHALR